MNVVGNLAQNFLVVCSFRSTHIANTASSGSIAIAFAVRVVALLWSSELRIQAVPLPASLVEVTCIPCLACATESTRSVKQDSPSTALSLGLPVLLFLAGLVLGCLGSS